MTATTQELETQLLEYISKKDSSVSFEQKKSDDLDFEMNTTKIKDAFSKPMLAMGVGAASSSLIAGAVASAIPVNLQFFAGAPTIVAALVGKLVIGSKGGEIVKNFINGVMIAGISQTVSRFIPATLPFGQEAKQNFSQEMKNQFKQETKPCNDIKTMRTDVTW
jgi:hypothetical protein